MMRDDGLCFHCKERTAVPTLPELSRPLPARFELTAVVLCEPCQRTADDWLTPEVYVSGFPPYGVTVGSTAGTGA